MNKSELLQWLQEEYQQFMSLLEQIGPERMDQPGVAADWSVKDIVAHLTGWHRDHVLLLQAESRGEPDPSPPWPIHLEEDDEINAWMYETNRNRSVQEILDETQQVFEQLVVVIAELPEDVRIEQVQQQERVYNLVWLGEKRFSAGEFFDHFHDDHEPDIRAWLARAES